MNFVRQVLLEVKKLLYSYFIIITGIIIIVFMVLSPNIGYFQGNDVQGESNPEAKVSVTIDGHEISGNNVFMQNLKVYTDIYEFYSSYDSDAARYARLILDELIQLNFSYAQIIVDDNYITEIGRRLESEFLEISAIKVIESEGDNFNLEAFDEVASQISSRYSSSAYYTKITKEERLEYLNKSENFISNLNALIINDDFSKYIDILITDVYTKINNFYIDIKRYETEIINNPNTEEENGKSIQRLLEYIEYLNEVEIPLINYRYKHNIVPGEGAWEDVVISDILNLSSLLEQEEYFAYTLEDFHNDENLVNYYGDYQEYLVYLSDIELNLLIAQKSLETQEPDIRYIPNGARYKTLSTYLGIEIMALFAILLGSYIITREYDEGTIKLLLIRPCTRTKILLTRYISGLIPVYLAFILVYVIIILINGFIYGFSDYFYPIYSFGGNINFFTMIFLQLILISVELIFYYSLSFFLSVVSKNIIVAILLPTILLVVANIILYIVPEGLVFVFYTPLPYLTLQDYYLGQLLSIDTYAALYNQTINPTLGITMLLAYFAVLLAISILIFKKRDIIN